MCTADEFLIYFGYILFICIAVYRSNNGLIYIFSYILILDIHYSISERNNMDYYYKRYDRLYRINTDDIHSRKDLPLRVIVNAGGYPVDVVRADQYFPYEDIASLPAHEHALIAIYRDHMSRIDKRYVSS